MRFPDENGCLFARLENYVLNLCYCSVPICTYRQKDEVALYMVDI
jgi:hypothetical protein